MIVEGDAALKVDDCVLETPSGVIEVSLDVQLEALQAVLAGGSGTIEGGATR